MLTPANQYPIACARNEITRPGAGTISRLLALLLCLLAVGASLTFAQTPPSGRSAPGDAALQKDLLAARQGDAQAELRLGRAYYNGAGTKFNPVEAFKWLEAASRQSSVEASVWLGMCYVMGRGAQQDQPRGIALIQAAAEKNSPVGFRFLGMLYASGQGFPRDYATAISLFSKATQVNDPPSFYHLGRLYLRGLGVEKDMGKAKALFVEGAKLGDASSQLVLGEMDLREDRTTPSAGNVAAARQLFTDSAAQGNRVAAFRLAKMYETGRGGDPDRRKALEYYRQSARRGYAPAQFVIGSWSELEANPPDLIRAYVWYSLAADQGSPEANERLAIVSGNLRADQLRQAQSVLSSWKESLHIGRGTGPESEE